MSKSSISYSIHLPLPCSAIPLYRHGFLVQTFLYLPVSTQVPVGCNIAQTAPWKLYIPTVSFEKWAALPMKYIRCMIGFTDPSFPS